MSVVPELAGWDNFYVIVGSAAGALIGLQFVVIALLANRPVTNSAAAGAAFASPTIVHFAVVLCLSALMEAPWRRVTLIAAVWGILGVGGVIYTVIVARRMQTQDAYRPEIEDWLFHFILPFAAYGLLSASALGAISHVSEAPFAVGVAALLLLFAGIHNSWDAATYHVLVQRHRDE
jgi:hypothetical protein